MTLGADDNDRVDDDVVVVLDDFVKDSRTIGLSSRVNLWFELYVSVHNSLRVSLCIRKFDFQVFIEEI